jgi:Pin2-interacting protein X1
LTEHFVSDKNKFGMRMLESMGWKEGRGLGAKEDGMTEHIKAVHRTNDDVRGMYDFILFLFR